MMNSETLENILDQVSVAVESRRFQFSAELDATTNYLAYIFTNLFRNGETSTTVALALATGLVAIAVWCSVTSIPHTALPATRSHELFDPSDLDADSEPIFLKSGSALWWQSCLSIGRNVLMVVGSLYTILNAPILVAIPALQCYRTVAGAFWRWYRKLRGLQPVSRYRFTLSDGNEELHRNSIFWYFNGMRNPHSRWFSRELRPTTIASHNQLGNWYFDSVLLVSIGASILTSYLYSKIASSGISNWIGDNLVVTSLLVWFMVQVRTHNYLSTLLTTGLIAFVTYHWPLQISFLVPIKFNTIINRFEFQTFSFNELLLPALLISFYYKLDIYNWHLKNIDTEFHFLNWDYCDKYFFGSFASLILAWCLYPSLREHTNADIDSTIIALPLIILTNTVLALLQGEFTMMCTSQYDVIEIENAERFESQEFITYDDLLNIVNIQILNDAEKNEMLVDDDDEDDEDYVDEAVRESSSDESGDSEDEEL